MLEIVYVLPLMVLAVLMILETVNFSSDSLVWNQNMNNLYHRIMADADQGTQNVFSSTTGMLTCNSGVVQPSGDASSLMQQQLYTWLKAKYDLAGATLPIGASDITIKNNQVVNATGDSFFVVEASYPMQTLVLPELKTLFNNIRVSGTSIYEIHFNCRAS
ncbi:hypothetical protein [Hydrogenovibrio kuenenii]|uniref:hypothetical protein n=1 Tax=Hydrogenovibrio kuenenii TaxID=63658 RepID=UPI0004650BDF|nr:hypothetical protein [Hydrogenovibrio kuenenii]